MTTLDSSTEAADLLAAAAALAGHRAGVDVPALLARYYEHVDDADLLDRSPEVLLGAVESHLELGGVLSAGTFELRVRTPRTDTDGWSVGRSVVEVVSEDMPFLVDSLTAELTRQGRAIHLVVHPVLTVERDAAGRLRSVGEGGRGESWIHLEVEQLDDDELVVVCDGVRRVLDDVRAAVDDWDRMADAALAVAARLHESPPVGVPAAHVAQAAEFLRWLAEDHATLLGYSEYAASDVEGTPSSAPVPGTALGLLARHGAGPEGPVGTAPQAFLRDPQPALLVISKATARSTVHRPAYLDSIAVRAFDAEGRVVGEHRFLGLFAASAYTESVLRLPVVKDKAREVLRRSGFAAMSHSGRDLLQILETYPRDELFQADVVDLTSVALAVLRLQERRRLRLFLRRDQDGGYMSCLVYLPRDRYGREVRLHMGQVLKQAFSAAVIDDTVRLSDSVLARVHFVARAHPGQELPDVDVEALERRLADTARSWEDGLAEALVARLGELEGTQLLRSHPDAFPEAYKEDYAPATGALDLVRVAALGPGDGLDMDLYRTSGGGPADLSLKVYSGGPMSLSAVLPVLRNMAVEVLDSRPYRLHGTPEHVYTFGLHVEGEVHPTPGIADLFQEAFAAAWRGEVESDGLNALVLRGGLSARQISVLRAYAKYLRQAGWTYSPSYVEQCLVAHAGIARHLVALFEAQFDPDLQEPREPLCERLQSEVDAALADVPSLDQDRILQAFLRAIRATTRTNHYQRTDRGGPKPYLSLKLDPSSIPGMPFPRPEREVWVCSPRVEGVHLRFGAVARGGLRWSDRPEDFRTEVLGLVKAQAVKNAVIVPVGAKGGFVAKRLPDPAVDREAWMAEGVECYKTLIRGMLDLADNRVDGRVVAPERTVRRDGDDSYLVVAADKGTATFSDIANGVAADYGFWLDDAFASGGSVGYDHKRMGITARGAWLSVERHFRELGIDSTAEDFTAVGIGDMSGDVFGNGMLLSPHLRLVAAFDHRHVFLDPDPDAARSFVERQRLFALPRSSWADYDPALLSAGGGVHPRSAKSIPISPQVRERLQLPEDCTRLTPQELMTAVLLAPVDLLWNGAIGTYVKASSESSVDVGDKANDPVRVDGRQLRCRVVGEGGNLGFTQLGRIEAARSGVRLNTDAIDNSAGVDCSDHEVNIKVLLDGVIAGGDLPREQRVELLAAMTDDVAELVLFDNREQNVMLGNARIAARDMLAVHRRYLRHLETAGLVDRSLEHLPSETALEARAAAGAGLTSPELAVLAAYAKNTVKTQLLGSGLPDEPWYERVLLDYFPARLAERFPEHVRQHPLRRQIIVTGVVNELVNRSGISFVFRAGEETQRSVEDVVRAYTVAVEVFGLNAHWRDVEGAPVPVVVQSSLHLAARRVLDRAVRRLLRVNPESIDVAAEVARLAPTVAALLPDVPDMVQGAEHGVLHAGAERRRAEGVPTDLALRSVALLHAFPLLDVVEIAAASGAPAADVACLLYAVSAAYDLDAQLERITALPRLDRWEALARSDLRDDLYAALARLTAEVLHATPPGEPEERIAQWEAANGPTVARARATLQEISAGEAFDLATMSVVVRTVRSLLRP